MSRIIGRMNTMSCQSVITRETNKYRLVEEGDRWHCIRCGACCETDFEDHWLDFLCKYENHGSINDKCQYLKFENNKYSCLIYSNRPNACKAFPFTLKRQDDGNYKLVIHTKCRGYGEGRSINIRNMILQCLRFSNREFHKRMRFDFSLFDNNKSVVLMK